MRAAAEVDEAVLLVERDLLALGQPLGELDLVGLALGVEALDRLLARGVDALEGMRARCARIARISSSMRARSLSLGGSANSKS